MTGNSYAFATSRNFCLLFLFLLLFVPQTQAQDNLPLTWKDEYFPQFHITIQPEGLAAVLEPGSTAKVPITLDYQGKTFAGTIRQRLGNSSLCGDKRQFRLDFPKKVTFPDNYVADRFETDRGNCYTLHEWVAWKMMDQAAQKHPELKVLRKKYNAVAIYFNGELYHVQTLLEDVNKDLLEPQLGTRNITVYENGCYGRTDPTEMNGFCSIFSPEQMREYLQVPSYLYATAVVQLLGGNDNYPSYPFNYNFVQETATNRIWFMADDMDSTIDSYGNAQTDPFQPTYIEGEAQRHFTELLAEAESRALYRSYLRELIPLLDPTQLKPVIAAKYAQIRDTLLASPDLPLGTDWYDYVYLSELPAWIDARHAFLNSIVDQGGGMNKAPSAVIAPLPATLTATDAEGVQLQLDATASSDPDNDTLTYLWTINGQEVGATAITDVKVQVGTQLIMLAVNDGHNGVVTATASIAILPLPSNKAPSAVMAPLPASLQATEVSGVRIQLNGAASTDPDNDSLAYSWKVDEQEVGTSAIQEVALSVGTHIITLIVNDGRGGNSTATAVIEVLPPPNKPPTAVIAPLPTTMEATSSEGAQIQLNGAASTDLDGESLTYGWSIDDQPVGDAAVLTVNLGIGVHTITLTVTDSRGATATATVSIEILPPPPPPPPTLSIKFVSPSRLSRDASAIIQISGAGFSPQAVVQIGGSSISILSYYGGSEENIWVYVRVHSFATPGARDVTVINPDGQSVTLFGAVTIAF